LLNLNFDFNKKVDLTQSQNRAIDVLNSKDNVFLTGHAGTGKSFVINHFQKSLPFPLPVLASTGAAAVLIDGRTFHGYFGLGIMEGGLLRTVKKAIANNRVQARLKKDHAIIIDEISMIHPEAFEAANRIAQTVRDSDAPFGGLRLIVVGDFLQLPPITPNNQSVQWLFEMDLWHQLDFKKIYLKETMRTDKKVFVDVLNSIREGQVTNDVKEFLDSRLSPVGDDFDGTVLFGRRNQAEFFNIKKLNQIPDAEVIYETEIKIAAKVQKTEDAMLALSPLPKQLKLKKNALVMLRKNDPDLKFVNGSLGRILKLTKEVVEVQLFTGSKVLLAKEEFHILDADGKKMATITNFPISLAWATTIHKSQGASIDRVHVDLRNLWECGQAYVALSRARSPENLFVEGWTTRSIKADPNAVKFYSDLNFTE
jgi:ATP-dependent DNA helicase PIF1